jgi:hypothetical protein
VARAVRRRKPSAESANPARQPVMISIVVPMAGRGSRFLQAGYDTPKPLIPIHGVPVIRVVIEIKVVTEIFGSRFAPTKRG